MSLYDATVEAAKVLGWWAKDRWREELRVADTRRSRLRSGDTTWLRVQGESFGGLAAMDLLTEWLVTSRLPDGMLTPPAPAGLSVQSAGKLEHGGVVLPQRCTVSIGEAPVAVLTVDVLEQAEPWT